VHRCSRKDSSYLTGIDGFSLGFLMSVQAIRLPEERSWAIRKNLLQPQALARVPAAATGRGITRQAPGAQGQQRGGD